MLPKLFHADLYEQSIDTKSVNKISCVYSGLLVFTPSTWGSKGKFILKHFLPLSDTGQLLKEQVLMKKFLIVSTYTRHIEIFGVKPGSRKLQVSITSWLLVQYQCNRTCYFDFNHHMEVDRYHLEHDSFCFILIHLTKATIDCHFR